MKTTARKKNPDPVSTFAALAGGVASALAISDRLNQTKRKAMKRKSNPTKTKRVVARTANGKKSARPKGDLYLLTISSGDDIETVILHDGDRDGFSKKFRTMAGAKTWATKNKKKLVPNPTNLKIARKRNVPGFIDENGVFHPIRSGQGYDSVAAGDHKSSSRKRSDARRNLKEASKKATTKKDKLQIARTWAKREGITIAEAKKQLARPRVNPAKKKRVVRRKKSNPKQIRSRTFETFQGRKPTQTTRVECSEHAPKKLVQLGRLVGFKLLDERQERVMNPARALLCAANGKLWIVGGRIARPDAKQPARVLNPIGHLDHIVYETHKPHHGDRPGTHYIHKLGDEGGTLPLLCVDRQGFAVLKGGSYKIKAEGIRD